MTVQGAVINAASGTGGVAVESADNKPVVQPRRSGSKSSSNVGKEHVNADMSGSNLANADFSGHRFTNVDLSNANLRGASFQGAELVNVSLENADLSGANLQGAKLVNVTLDGALTTGAIWTNGRRR